jgi:hypothetical protein
MSGNKRTDSEIAFPKIGSLFTHTQTPNQIELINENEKILI